MKTRSNGRMAGTSLTVVGVSLAAVGWSIAGAAAAQTPPAPASEEARVQELEAEVRQLAAEVRELKAAQATAGETIATRPQSDANGARRSGGDASRRSERHGSGLQFARSPAASLRATACRASRG